MVLSIDLAAIFIVSEILGPALLKGFMLMMAFSMRLAIVALVRTSIATLLSVAVTRSASLVSSV